MPDYLPDKDYTAERIADLAAAVEMARYELAAGIVIGQELGLSWADIGAACSPPLTRQGAQQKFGRGSKHAMTLSHVDTAERDRIGRLIGVNSRKSHFEVVRLHGRRGVSAVTFVTVSRHRTRDTATEAGRTHVRRTGEAVEIHRVDPDGERTVLRALNRSSINVKTLAAGPKVTGDPAF